MADILVFCMRQETGDTDSFEASPWNWVVMNVLLPSQPKYTECCAVLCGWLGLGMKPAGGWWLLHPAYLHTAALHSASNINVLVTRW